MLQKAQRIKKKNEILSIKQSRQYRTKTTLLSLIAKDNNLDHSRLIVVAGKKLGNAVKRNYIRRRLANAFRQLNEKILKNVDIMIYPQLIPSPSPEGLRTVNYAGELKLSLGKCGLI